MLNTPLRIHRYPLATAIHRSPEFAKKKLADFSVNVGVKCGHACTYCSSGAVLRCHRAFRELGESPFKNGYAIVDPDIPEKVAAESKRIRKRGLVQLCTTVDAWCPAAQQHDLGRRCLEALLSEPGWTVRILTKNTAVARDFDLVEKHRDRVLVGLSLTGTADKDKVLAVVEPNASPVSERMQVLREAQRPRASHVWHVVPVAARHCRCPGANRRTGGLPRSVRRRRSICRGGQSAGPGLKATEDALRESGFLAEADSLARIRHAENWSVYVADLIHNLQVALRTHNIIDKLRFLLYPTKLLPTDRTRIEADSAGVVWL